MKSLTECAGFWYLGGVFGWGLWFTDTSTLGHFCICWCPENWVEYFETYNLFNVLSSINLPPHPTIKMSFSDIELIFLNGFVLIAYRQNILYLPSVEIFSLEFLRLLLFERSCSPYPFWSAPLISDHCW